MYSLYTEKFALHFLMMVWNNYLQFYSQIVERKKKSQISNTCCKHETCHFAIQNSKIKASRINTVID